MKAASGHTAGLHSKHSFVDEEKELASSATASKLSKGQLGGNQETVYRDKRGRKMDMLSEFMHQQEVTAGRAARKEKEQFEWGRGLVQKQKDVDKRDEFEKVKAAPFSRYADDEELNESLRQRQRADDPMAAMMNKKSDKKRAASGKPVRPTYKGPQPPPNRFRIPPGYRWDGSARGTGFEGRLLAKASMKGANEEERYKWSTSDM